MDLRGLLHSILVCALLLCACDYIVLPEEEMGGESAASKGWSAVVTKVGKSDAGDLRVELTIRNETADWSAMQGTAPAVLTTGDGKTSNCDTVFVGTGGHRLAPGFQMRGYVSGTAKEPKTQLLYVDCKGAEATPGSKLAFDYSSYYGEYNYYEKEGNKVGGRIEVDLDQVAADVKYPIAESIEGLIQARGAEIVGLNNVVLTLTDAQRTADGIEFKWHTSNPGEYPSYVHIGNPPVIGSDGILYGRYESPDLASVPVTGAGKTAEWTTQVKVPNEISGLYVLPSVESKKQRLFVNYAINITDR